MPATPRSSYGHFCMLAKTLEVLGERWALLVVRDLLTGPKRFTDLMDRLGGITPRTLTQRLRDLEAEGLVTADRRPGRREVWYALTPAGAELQPAISELTLWGMHHRGRPPAADEPTHPEHTLRGVVLILNRERVNAGSVRWTIRTSDRGDAFTIRGARGKWTFEIGASDEADLEIIGSRRSLAEFLTTPAGMRSAAHPGIEFDGSEAEISRFLGAISAFPQLSVKA